jgi:hypothetical protein
MTPPGRVEAALAARSLHGYLVGHHLRDGVLVGPDSGVRLNYRFGRFLKSYASWLPWHDELCYLQTQGYWCLASWERGDPERAIACAQGMLARQRPDGAWDYPNREWRGRVATAEGTWAALGLIETYRHTGDPSYLDSALRWQRFLEREIGWHDAPGGSAVGYFAGESDGEAVPNNSAFVARMLAELAAVTGDEGLLGRCDGMMSFLATVQRSTGELPYVVRSVGENRRLSHFQCSQYTAFQLLDLARYEELSGDPRAAGLVTGLGTFLVSMVAEDGTVRYACGRANPRVTYHFAAVSTALDEAARRGVRGARETGDAALRQLLKRQRPDGGFPHSERDYGVLTDRRSYPRNLSMILHHLLVLARPAPPV